jgi:hypothetical protein
MAAIGWAKVVRPKYRTGNATPVILVANDPHPSPAADVVHEAMHRPQLIQGTGVGSAVPDQPGRIERLPLGAEVRIDVRVVDGPVERGRIGTGDHEGPDSKLPVSHVQTHADRRSKLVAVAGKEVPIRDIDARRISEQAINLHCFDNDAAKISQWARQIASRS